MTKRKAPDEPHLPVGRPTDFKQSYGDEILALMAEGLSLAASAAALGFHRQRVYEWVDRHPEFADTVKLAQAKRQLFLEKRLLSAEIGPVVTSTIFALKNAGPEDWRERVINEHTGKDGEPITLKHTSAVTDMSEEEREMFRAMVLARKGRGEGDQT